MYYVDDFGGTMGMPPHKCKNTAGAFVCKCKPVGGVQERPHHGCGCGNVGGAEDKGYHHHKKDNCEGCVCEQLKKLTPYTELKIYREGAPASDDGIQNPVKFIALDPKTCCAYFKETDDDLVIIDCRKISHLKFED